MALSVPLVASCPALEYIKTTSHQAATAASCRSKESLKEIMKMTAKGPGQRVRVSSLTFNPKKKRKEEEEKNVLQNSTENFRRRE
jgi:hypothetical protein